ncbi:MAG TPA: hypothetical protein VGN42_20065 [Pirellulales bacterium]|jgi:hypothetical protein|nr:hypothetical protein [Pirellulales bacterium]
MLVVLIIAFHERSIAVGKTFYTSGARKLRDVARTVASFDLARFKIRHGRWMVQLFSDVK